MKSNSITELEMQKEEAPSPKSTQDLSEYIESLVERKHDYGTCVYAMSLAATASFNYVASKLGVTGFQASCADLDILKRTRGLKCPFILLKAEDMLYPQYDLHGKLAQAMEEWKEWAKEQAIQKLNENKDKEVHHDFWARWEALAQ